MCWYIVYLIELIGCGYKGQLSTPDREREEGERKKQRIIALIIIGVEEVGGEKSTEGGNIIKK